MQRLLVVGYGDIARRATPLLAPRFSITGLSRHAGFDLDALSFMQESRRLDNARLKQVLGVRLRYPTVDEGLRHEHAIGIH
jgi:hypothetical protein